MSERPDLHPDLDLDDSIRPGLDILANEIVIALTKRTRFAENPAVYVPGLVRGNPEVSLLEHVLGSTERVHATLGRYTYASQDAFTDVADVEPVIERPPPSNAIQPVGAGIGPQVIAFYRDWIASGCRAGSEPDTYGETATADVNALLCILERVSLGRYVAEAKLTRRPEAYRATRGDRDALLGLIVHKDREAQVCERARNLAAHYGLEPALAVTVFEWMIGMTIDIEIDYLRARLELDADLKA